LPPEQRTSIIADEDATLVLAGAGSGKTSVITAKAGYLIKSGIRQPEEILSLQSQLRGCKENHKGARHIDQNLTADKQ